MQWRAWVMAAGLFLTVPAAAREPQRTDVRQDGELDWSAADLKFAHAAWQLSLTDISLADVAERQGNHLAVKRFARMLADDHAKARDDLDALLKDANVSHDERLDEHAQALHDRLAHLDGEAFDRAYVEAMVKLHVDAAAQFDAEREAGSDEKLKDFAKLYAPMVDEHAQQGRELKKRWPCKK